MLNVTPPKLPSDGGIYSAVVVSLADMKGLPSIAPADTRVFLTASPDGIVSVPNSVSIRAGREYVVVNVTTTVVSGSATITASSPGLSSVSSTLTTLGPSGYPSKLRVFVSPSQYLPRNDTGVVRVELVDDAGLPSKAISAVTALISSSNAGIAKLDQASVTILPGNFYASGTFRTSNKPGDAVITAAAASTGFTSGTALLTVVKGSVCIGECGPGKIQLKLLVPGAPGVLPTDGRPYDALEISLTDSTGAPAVSPSDTTIRLSSSKSEVASTLDLVTIPANKISTIATITTSSLAGLANVTAFSSGLLPNTITVKTVIPAPSKLQVFVSPPSTTFASNGNWPFLVVQLQDSAGNPARARQDTTTIITSSNSSLVKTFLSLTIATRDDYAFSLVNASGVGSTVLTAVSPGLSSSKADLQTVQSPLVVGLTTPKSFIYSNESATFTLTANFLGKPLDGLNVTWGATGGTILPNTGVTGAGGSASATFTPSGSGSKNITATAFSPGTGQIKGSYSLVVYQAPPKAPLTILQFVLMYWYFIAAAVAAALVAVFYLFRLRRKKQRAEIEAGFEVV